MFIYTANDVLMSTLVRHYEDMELGDEPAIVLTEIWVTCLCFIFHLDARCDTISPNDFSVH